MEGLLYHSFPRRAGEETLDDQVRRGLGILRGFFDVGLILAPEIVRLSEALENAEPGRELTIGQKRLCFTNIGAGEIVSHAKVFGPVSIEFGLDDMVANGATPVFYYPPHKHEEQIPSAAASLILPLGDLANLTAELNDLKTSILNRPGTDVCQLNWDRYTAPIRVAELSAVLAYLEHKHGSFFSANASLRGLGQLFYPTHDVRYVGPYAYYAQREWRLIGDLSYKGRPISRPLNEDEKAYLLSANQTFFGREVELLDGRHRRVDQCRLYNLLNGGHPMSLARRVVLPKKYMKQAQAIIRAAGFDIPVAALEKQFPFWKRASNFFK